jgi:hypothetical protein
MFLLILLAPPVFTWDVGIMQGTYRLNPYPKLSETFKCPLPITFMPNTLVWVPLLILPTLRVDITTRGVMVTRLLAPLLT